MRLNNAELTRTRVDWKFLLPIILWVGLNLTDSICTYNIIRLGGQENWFIFQWTQSMAITTVVKWLAVVLIPLILWKYKKVKWLWLFNAELMVIVGWNVWQLATY